MADRLPNKRFSEKIGVGGGDACSKLLSCTNRSRYISYFASFESGGRILLVCSVAARRFSR